MAVITGSEVLAQSLRSQGLDTLFYLMGGPMLETEAACITLGIRAIDTRHEQAAALSAHAWGRVMRRPGVAMGASGPGTTNLLTGVADAFTNAEPYGVAHTEPFAHSDGLGDAQPNSVTNTNADAHTNAHTRLRTIQFR